MLIRRLLLITLLGLSSCTTRPSAAPPGPPDYREGYSAGCDSGYAAARHPYYRARRDWDLYERNERYRLGWDEGYTACKDRYNSLS